MEEKALSWDDVGTVVGQTKAPIEQRQAFTEKPTAQKGYVGSEEELSSIHKEAKDVYEKLKGFFTRTEGKEFSPEEAGKMALGGAGAGAITGLATPKALELAGKVIPGAPGKVISGLGTAWGEVGPIRRMLTGTLGGASSGLSGEIAKSAGLSPAEQSAVELVAGGAGEFLASLPTKSAVLVGKLFGSAAVGSPSGIAGATLGLMGPNKLAFKQAAEKESEKLFGKKIPGYVEGIVGTQNKTAVKRELMDADQSIPKTIAPDRSVSSYYRDDVMNPEVNKIVGNSQKEVSSLENKRKALEVKYKDYFAKPWTYDPKGAVARTAQKAKKDIDIGISTAQKDLFSNSTPFSLFSSHLDTLVGAEQITRKQADDLIKELSIDVSKNPNISMKFSENIDATIREWGQSSEKGIAEGYKAVSQKVANDVRGTLRESYNKWLTSRGLGRIEEKYRAAFTKEKAAEARDTITHLLHYGKGDELEKIGRIIASDDITKPQLLSTLRQYLAQADIAEIASKYNSIDRLLVGNNLISAQDILPIREGVKKVVQTAEKGEKLQWAEKVRRMLIRAIPYQTGAITGTAIGESRE